MSEASAATILSRPDAGLDYILRRIAVYLAADESNVRTVMQHALDCGGWLEVTALTALGGGFVANRRVGPIAVVRNGAAHGGSHIFTFSVDDVQVRMRIVALPRGAVPFDHWLNSASARIASACASLQDGGAGVAVVVTVAFPVTAASDQWERCIRTVEAATAAHELQHVDFVTGGGDSATVALWLAMAHAGTETRSVSLATR
jgi:hypothetical protein